MTIQHLTLMILPIAFLIAASAVTDRDPMSPSVLLPASYAIYTLMLPISFIHNSTPVSTLESSRYMLAQVAGTTGLALGWVIARFGKSIEGKVMHSTERLLAATALLWIGLSWLLTILQIVIQGWGAFLAMLKYGSERYLFYRDLGFLHLSRDWMIFGLVLLAYVIASGKYGRLNCFYRVAVPVAVSTGVVWVFMSLLSGERSALVRLALMLLLVYHYTVRRFTWGNLLVALMLLYVPTALWGHVRGDFAVYGVLRTVQNAARLAVEHPSLLLPIHYGEFANPARSLFYLVNAGGSFEPWLGLSYLRLPLQFIPNFVIGGRPPTPAGWYNSEVNARLFASGGGTGMVTAAEGFLNFGYVGVVAHMLIMGWSLNTLYRSARLGQKSIPSSSAILPHIFVFGYVVLTGMRIDVAPVVKTLFFGYLIPYYSLLALAGISTGRVVYFRTRGR